MRFRDFFGDRTGTGNGYHDHTCPRYQGTTDFLASKTGRSKLLLCEIVERGMEDIKDYYLSIDVLERIRSGEEVVYSSAEVRRDLGLDDRIL